MPQTASKNPVVPDFTMVDFTDVNRVKDYLMAFGYHNLLGIPTHAAAAIDVDSVDHKLMVSRHQSFYAHSLGTQPDGILGPIGRAEMNKPRCACPDIQPAGAAWDMPCRLDLKVFCEFPRLKKNTDWPNAASYEAEWYAAFGRIRAACNINYQIIDNDDDAQYYAYDGSTGGNVFAWSEFPSGCSGQSESLFGRKWDWGKSLWQDTAIHEIMHGMGLPHGPAGSIMYWTTSGDDYYGELQRWDIKQLVDRYGEPTWTEPQPTDPIIDPTDPTTPSPKLTLPLNIRITNSGITYSLGDNPPVDPISPPEDDNEIDL